MWNGSTELDGSLAEMSWTDRSAFKRDERPTTRTAWDEVRDYTTREVQAREAMVGALKEVVVKELVRLKVGCADLSQAVTQCS